MSLTTIQISTETDGILSRLQDDLKKILKKKNISKDTVIKLLLLLKMDASDVLIEIENLIKEMDQAKNET